MQVKALLAAPLVAWLMVASAATFEKPKNWSWGSTGYGAERYQMGVDSAVTWEGKPALAIAGAGMVGAAFGDIHNFTSATGYAGRRVRFSGVYKLADVDGWAGAYLLAYDGVSYQLNPMSPPAAIGGKGNQTDWTPFNVVIEVPKDASTLRMGLLLAGNGRAWLSNLKFEEVADDVPLTMSRPAFDLEGLKRDSERRRAYLEKMGKQQPWNLELKTQ